jgi:hypothetical protein
MVDANTPASTKVRTADSILNHTIKAIEIEDIAAGVAAVRPGLGTAPLPRADYPDLPCRLLQEPDPFNGILLGVPESDRAVNGTYGNAYLTPHATTMT